MTLPTCNVLCKVFDDSGAPVAGATVRAKLNQFEVYNGYVVPQDISGTTNASGECTLALWPNQLGSTGSMYTVKVQSTNGKSLTVNAVVPNVSSTELHLIAELPAYEGKTDGQLILDAAVAAGAIAVAKAAEASSSADAAASSAASAATSASGASTSAGTASTQAGIATTKASQAATSETNAANSATTASNQAGTATTKASEAASSASSASTAAGTATTKASEALTSANNAASSATTATNKASDANTSATYAAASASAASGSSTAAAGSASDASSSAAAAAGSAITAASQASTATTQAGNAATSASASAGSASTAASQATTATGAASTATTQAGAASASATNAGTSATAAAGSATSAATSASSATNSASAAATSATAAAGSNTAAAAQASAAAGSASSALAIYGSTAAMNTAVSTSTTNANNAASSATAASGSATAAAASAASAAAIVTGVSSNRPSVRPSLLIDFAAMGKLDPRITFGRSSPAMAYDGKTTVMAEQNLILYSQDQSQSQWGYNATAVTRTANAAVAPDGTTTASSVVGDGTTGVHYFGQNVTLSSSLVYTFSFFIKANGVNYIQLLIDAGSGYVNFDLLNGVIGNYSAPFSSPSIVSVGSGWYRCAVSLVNPANSSIYFALCNSATTIRAAGSFATSLGVYLWGAQLEQRTYATAYTPTTTAAITNYIPALQSYAANVARFDFNPVTGESLGLMVEEQRTNLVLYSQQFDVPTWVKNLSSIAANVAIAPDGTLTASKLIPDTSSSGAHRLQQSVSTTGAVTFSFYAKAAGYSHVAVTASANNWVYFDLSAGTVESSLGTGWSAATITPVGNGWYRCSATSSNSSTIYYFGAFNATASNGNTAPNFSGDGYSGIYIWGAQLEAGAFATSYIPTLLTYSGRGSVATYIGDNGLIQTAAANVARYQRNIAGAVQLLLEGAASNLVPWSGNFSSVSDWLVARAFIIPNAIVAPDGTKTGAKIVAAAGTTTDHGPYKSINSASANGVTHTLSVYAKAGEFNWILLAETSGYFGRYFNVATGEIGGSTSWYAPVSSLITPVGNGWYRCQITWVQSGTVLRPVVAPCAVNNNNSYTGDGVSGNYTWGWQLEVGSVATSYIPSTETWSARTGPASYFDPSGVMRTAPAGLARYDFDPVTGLSKGLLIEAAGTNLLLYSSSQNGADWVKNGCSIAADAVIAPDGTLTADAIIEDTSTGNHRTYQIVVVTSGATYTASLYVKAKDITQVSLVETTMGGALFDLNALTASGATPYTITPVGNGWYRLSITITPGSTSLVLQVRLYKAGQVSYTGDGLSGLYVWGAQCELGSVATSYIPTTSAQVTRAADTATSVANSRAADVWSSGQATRTVETATMGITGWFSSLEGTMYAEASNFSASDTNGILSAYNTAALSANYLDIRVQSGQHRVFDSGLGPISLGSYTQSAFYKLCASFKGSSIAAVRAGGSQGTLTAAFNSGSVNQLQIGNIGGGGYAMNGYLKRIAFYPKALSTTEQQGLTS